MLSAAPASRGHLGIVGSLNPSSGGEFQYSLSILRAVNRLGGRDVTVFARLHERAILDELALSDRFVAAPFDPPGASRLVGGLKSLARYLPMATQLQEWRSRYAHPIHHVGAFRSNPAAGAHFRARGASWIFYTAPNALSFEAGVPFAMPIHDMQHRLQPQFPEVSADGEWERREYLFGNAARQARMILVDSDIGKEDVLDAYRGLGLTKDRIGVLPFLPPDYLRHSVTSEERQDVRRHHKLPPRYLFYPAQFWPHKNHQRLVEAVASLAGEHPDLNLVLVGSASGSARTAVRDTVFQSAHRLGIASRIFDLGYVPNSDMAALYSEAVALVFPTFFGPTNIPILEAWALGIPVITSRIRGIIEQVGDAGLLVDPSDVAAIAEAMDRTWKDEALRAGLVARGHERLAAYDVAQFDSRLAGILDRIDHG